MAHRKNNPSNWTDSRGSVNLVSEALILVLIAILGFVSVQLLITDAGQKMEDSSEWLKCEDVLDCPELENSH